MSYTNINEHLKRKFGILQDLPVSHAHLLAPVSGIVISTEWTKLNLNETQFDIETTGGFTFDEINNRFYWDLANNHDFPINAFFVGDAGLEVTAGIGGGIVLSLGLFIDNTLILETPLNFSSQLAIKAYGANDYLIDDVTKEPLLQQGSYVEYFMRSSAGTPTVQLDYFNVTVVNR